MFILVLKPINFAALNPNKSCKFTLVCKAPVKKTTFQKMSKA